MSGKTIRLLERTAYDYSNIGGGGTTGELPLYLDADISGARETTVLIRVHAVTTSGTGKITIIARASAPTNEEPNQYFRDATALVSTDLTQGGTVPPCLVRMVIPANAGSWLSIFIKGTQSSSQVTVNATISIDLSMKD